MKEKEKGRESACKRVRERRRESDGRTDYFSPNTEKVERNVSAAIFIFVAADVVVVDVVDVVADVVVVDVVVDVNGRARMGSRF